MGEDFSPHFKGKRFVVAKETETETEGTKKGKKNLAAAEEQADIFVNKHYAITVSGEAPLIFNRMPMLNVPKSRAKNQAKIDPVENEWQTWKEKLHFREDLGVYIPADNWRESLKGAAKYWGMRRPGEGMKTYTELITVAVVCEELALGIMSKEDPRIIPYETMVNGNPTSGKGGGKVFKIRPMVMPPWGGTFRIHVYDGRLHQEVLLTILQFAGMLGHCDRRPHFGRFKVVGMEEVEL